MGPAWSQERGTGQPPRGCRQGPWGFSLTVDTACPGQTEPRLDTEPGATRGGKALAVHTTLLVLAEGQGWSYEWPPTRYVPRCPQAGQARKGSALAPAFTTREKSFCSRAAQHWEENSKEKRKQIMGQPHVSSLPPKEKQRQICPSPNVLGPQGWACSWGQGGGLQAAAQQTLEVQLPGTG